MGVCVLACPDNTLIDNVLFNCYTCGSYCSSCVTFTNNCLTCDNGWSLYNNLGTINGTCLSACPVGWYSDGKKCKKCDPACTECTGYTQC